MQGELIMKIYSGSISDRRGVIFHALELELTSDCLPPCQVSLGQEEVECCQTIETICARNKTSISCPFLSGQVGLELCKVRMAHQEHLGHVTAA